MRDLEGIARHNAKTLALRTIAVVFATNVKDAATGFLLQWSANMSHSKQQAQLEQIRVDHLRAEKAEAARHRAKKKAARLLSHAGEGEHRSPDSNASSHQSTPFHSPSMGPTGDVPRAVTLHSLDRAGQHEHEHEHEHPLHLPAIQTPPAEPTEVPYLGEQLQE